jgi:putative hydrolase of the HAD superfamily
MQVSVAEYAEWQSRRHLRRRTYPIVPANIKEKLQRIENVGAVLWDVYGTLMAVSVGDLKDGREKEKLMLEAFRRTAREFGLLEFPGNKPEERLMEMYVKEIEKTHRRKRSHGVFSPEVKIEQIWMRVLRKLESAGYRTQDADGKAGLDLAFRIAYFFDDVYHTKRLYAGARETLEGVKTLGLMQGIISNAQFYTPIALGILLRRARRRFAGHTHKDETPFWRHDAASRLIRGHDAASCPRISSSCLKELFDSRLMFFSYCLGVAKPNPRAFELARLRLKNMGIPPDRVLYVGNDLHSDMTPARKVGFKCVLYAGDKESLMLRRDHSDCSGFKPDAIIKSLPQLLSIIEGKRSARLS